MFGRVSCPYYIGRAEELAYLREALDLAAAGEPRVIIVAGEAGIGKTRLVLEFMGQARKAGARAILGGCIPLADQGLPYAPVHEALMSLTREAEDESLRQLQAASPSETMWFQTKLSEGAEAIAALGLEPMAGKHRMFGLLVSLLGRLGENKPTLLVIEDLHFADSSTLDLLAFLLRNLHDERVLLVGTYRDELTRAHALTSWLAEQLRNRHVERISLSRFDRTELSAQISGIRGVSPASELVDEIFVRSDGNAFHAEELLAAWKDTDHSELPPGLRQILTVRIQALTQDAQTIVRVAAVGGRRVAERLIREVTDLDTHWFYEALHEAVDHHILVQEAEHDSFSFRHALMREVVYADLLPGERTRLHTRYARALTHQQDQVAPDPTALAGELAHHWYHARKSRPALEWAGKAASAAEDVFAFGEALRHYETVLELWNQVPDAADLVGMGHASTFQRAAQCAHLVGKDETAISLIKAALKGLHLEVSRPSTAALYERLGWYEFTLWRVEPAFEAFEQALRLLPPDPPSVERAAVLAAWGGCGCLVGRLRESRALSEEAVALARQIGARLVEGRSLQTLGYVLAEMGEFDDGLRHLRGAVEIAEEVKDLDTVARAHASLAYMTGLAGRHEEAADLAFEGLKTTQRVGLEAQYGSVLRYVAALSLLHLGRWDEAHELVHAHAEQGMGEVGLLLVSSALAIERGDFDSAHSLLSYGRALFRGGFRPLWKAALLENVASLAIWEGRLDRARSAVTEGLDVLAGTDEERFTGPLLALGLRAEADRAAAARVWGGTEEINSARATVDALLDRAAGFRPNPLDAKEARLPDASAVAATVAAERSRMEGGADPEEWAAVAAGWDSVSRPYPAAYARWREAQSRIANGERANRTEAALRRSYRTAVMLSAVPLCRELEVLARSTRIDLERKDEEQALPASPAEKLGLTRREVEVLALLAARRSNKEIAGLLYISPKTASVHVSHILEKLGVSSRIEAAEAARRLGIGPSSAPYR